MYKVWKNGLKRTIYICKKKNYIQDKIKENKRTI